MKNHENVGKFYNWSWRKVFSMWMWQQEEVKVEVEVEVEVEEMYIELQLEALGSEVVIPERGQCSLGHGESWPNFSWKLQNLISNTMVVLPGPETPRKCPKNAPKVLGFGAFSPAFDSDSLHRNTVNPL